MNYVTEDVVSAPGVQTLQISSRTLKAIPRVGDHITHAVDDEERSAYVVISVDERNGEHIITAERPATVYTYTYPADWPGWAYVIPPDADEPDD